MNARFVVIACPDTSSEAALWLSRLGDQFQLA
jgi:hypothetical protein